jgi:hypothetical protein
LTASGPSNAWILGIHCANQCLAVNWVLDHWNGTAWQSVALPKPYRTGSTLLGSVATASSGRTWLFGASAKQPGTALMWTGKSWGPTVRLPASPGIFAAIAVGASQAWAFGAYGNTGEIGAPYAAHYAGGTWKQVKVPLVATLGSHASVTPVGDIWVAGEDPKTVAAKTMVFNGKTWRTVPLPTSGPFRHGMDTSGIAAVSATNAWVLVGAYGTSADPTLYLLHWTGKSWRQVKVPYPGIVGGVHNDLALDGRGGVWMVLTRPVGTGSKMTIHQDLVHYANGAWSRVAAPVSPGYFLADLTLAAIPGTRSLWGVGAEVSTTKPSGTARMLILKYGP